MPDLTPDMLLKAYAVGVFPMAEDRNDPELFWVDPRMRGIILLDEFHVPRRLRRTIRQGAFTVTFDMEFEAVIESCAEATGNRPRTWINDRIIELYSTLYRMGHAHSVECWRDGQLAGGLYGVSLGGIFFGESMFSRDTDASKVALVYLAASLKLGAYHFIDTQFITKHLVRFGAKEIPRSEYRILLSDALATRAAFVRTVDPGYVTSILSG
ncbi:MAG: leucyl/phenylalanyl-tRNA--protein transferase [Alphaproteobacteria bacterium]|nr:leucyl/phenylalanyl-tRNA--protein transferase [Alphaproteobacteria bacterium]